MTIAKTCGVGRRLLRLGALTDVDERGELRVTDQGSDALALGRRRLGTCVGEHGNDRLEQVGVVQHLDLDLAVGRPCLSSIGDGHQVVDDLDAQAAVLGVHDVGRALGLLRREREQWRVPRQRDDGARQRRWNSTRASCRQGQHDLFARVGLRIDRRQLEVPPGVAAAGTSAQGDSRARQAEVVGVVVDGDERATSLPADLANGGELVDDVVQLEILRDGQLALDLGGGGGLGHRSIIGGGPVGTAA